MFAGQSTAGLQCTDSLDGGGRTRQDRGVSGSSYRTGLAVVGGIVGAAVLAAAIGSSDADAARPSKHRRKPEHHRRDAAAAVDSFRERAPVDAGADSAPGALPSPASSAPPYPSTGLICLYGKVTEDGGDRCLSPEELDPPRIVIVDTRPLAEQLGMLRPEAPDTPDDAGADGGDDDTELSTDGTFKARVVSLEFENGGVGGARNSLRHMRRDIADCVADNGGLRSDSARLKLLFYVRGDGKASGVMVASARNVPPAVVRCISKLVEGASVGRPSNNPVGVKALFELKEN